MLKIAALMDDLSEADRRFREAGEAGHQELLFVLMKELSEQRLNPGLQKFPA